MNIGNYLVIESCFACPEAYSIVNSEGDEIGYLRLRWGSFSAWTMVNGEYDKCVYRYTWPNDPYKGSFDSLKERGHYINIALTIFSEMGL